MNAQDEVIFNDDGVHRLARVVAVHGDEATIRDRASQIVALAQIIQEEEGCTPDAAYALAEQEIDAVHTVATAWSAAQAVTASAGLTITPTAWGIILRRAGVTTVIYPNEVASVLAMCQAYQMRGKQ